MTQKIEHCGFENNQSTVATSRLIFKATNQKYCKQNILLLGRQTLKVGHENVAQEQ